MKEVNIVSIIVAYKSLASNLFRSYLGYFNIEAKNSEIEDLESLTRLILDLNKKVGIYEGFGIYEGYYIGYNIPQIGKEFDLLRIGTNYVVNIELKRESTEDKIKKQLKQNRYYLSFLGKKTYTFTYVSNSKQLFEMDEKFTFKESNLNYLVSILSDQKNEKISDINALFNPTNYLVSPFNSTKAFVENKYFLTSQQEEFKNTILKKLSSRNYETIAIKGKAGTGKTLLTYDIAKEYILKSKKVILIHCGQLNPGHFELINIHEWNIIPAKNLRIIDSSNFDLLIVDEAQRIYPAQLGKIINKARELGSKCLFSYDAQQCLRAWEINNNNDRRIEQALTVSPPFELTGKIRTNKEIATFILCLFDKKKQIEKINHPNIELNYFQNNKQAKAFLIEKQKSNWKAINYTPSSKYRSPYDDHQINENQDNAHTVIGQEYDKVIAVIDEYFYYKNDNELSTRNYPNRPYYHPTKMLFQIMSRTRLKLSVVIINNSEILQRCLDILQKS